MCHAHHAVPVDQITSIVSLSTDAQTHSAEVALVTTTGQKTFKVFSQQHYAAFIDGLGGLLQQAFTTDKVCFLCFLCFLCLLRTHPHACLHMPVVMRSPTLTPPRCAQVKSEYNVLFQAIQYAKQLEPAVPGAPPALPQ